MGATVVILLSGVSPRMVLISSTTSTSVPPVVSVVLVPSVVSVIVVLVPSVVSVVPPVVVIWVPPVVSVVLVPSVVSVVLVPSVVSVVVVRTGPICSDAAGPLIIENGSTRSSSSIFLSSCKTTFFTLSTTLSKSPPKPPSIAPATPATGTPDSSPTLSSTTPRIISSRLFPPCPR